MEKLLGLLNERNKELNPSAQVKWTELRVEINEWYLISKKCGFIKRLVDNDKIDLDKTGYKKADFQEVWNGDWRTIRGYEMLLMLLSISDTPIEDLILYLK